MPEEANEQQQVDPVQETESIERIKSLYETFREVAEKNRSTPALIFWRRRFTYSAVLSMVDSLASSFRSRFSLENGSRIGILLPNSPQLVVSIYAASKAGCVSVPINPRSSVREVENVVKHSGISLIVVPETLLGKVRHLAGENFQIVVTRMQDFVSFGSAIKKAFSSGFNYIGKKETGTGIVKFSDLVYSSPDSDVVEYFDPSDTAMLAYSGSTSTTPKAASITHRNIYSSIASCTDWFPRIERRTVTIAAVPFHHMFSMILGLLVPLSSGCTTVLIDDHRNIDNVLGSITEYICDYFIGNPSIFRSIMEHGNLLKYRMGTVKVFMSGGDTVSEDFSRAFEEATGSSIVTTYGTKELTGVSHINPLDRKKRKYGSIGLLIGSTEGRILDEDTGNEVPAGSTGILAIRGNQVMKEYWNNEEATRESFRDGWFLTGDMARVDEDGFFYIYERRREAIVTDSSMVSASEIEEVLMQSPKVDEVAVIGIPDERKGEVVKAYVVAKPGEKISERELKEMCEIQLSEYKRPTVYEFRTELPKNMDGQVIKRILKEESAREAR